MIDWEDLAQRQITKIQRALPEPIRARAAEVPVFFCPARDEKSFAFLGVFEGYSLIEGSPNQPDEMPRITLFSIRWLKQRITEGPCFSARFGLPISTNWDITLGGMKDRLPMSA